MRKIISPVGPYEQFHTEAHFIYVSLMMSNLHKTKKTKQEKKHELQKY